MRSSSRGKLNSIATALWLTSFWVVSVQGRWLSIQQAKTVITLNTDWETGEETEVLEPWERWSHFTDAATPGVTNAWRNGGCANGIVTDDNAFLAEIQYYAGDIDPGFPFVLSGIEIHDGDNCMDPNFAYMPIESEENNAIVRDFEQMVATQGNVNQPDEPEQNDSEFTAMEIEAQQGVANDLNSGPFDNTGTSSPKSAYQSQGGFGNGLRKRSPIRDMDGDDSDVTANQNQEQGESLPLGTIELGPENNGGPNLNQNPNPQAVPPDTQALIDQYILDRADQLDEFLAETTPSGTSISEEETDPALAFQDAETDFTTPFRGGDLESDFESPTGDSDILDYDRLLRDNPNYTAGLTAYAGPPQQLPHLTTNLFLYGYKFRARTSIRFINNYDFMWLAPGIPARVQWPENQPGAASLLPSVFGGGVGGNTGNNV
ncbi:hypothetical protein DRE_03546 [Drechslerella stenobrocha 248]|uniref:Uncharacterized protein n=1 Tax=Drechslerella stenobrocha 248 TaxID=1043628 RepID=W7I423_9PEZI|nr:hypothetical protein DRE_03546 [Drechslerella stenobrocha 248]